MIVTARASGFGATISGVTVRDVRADAEIEAIRAVLERYGVVVLHDQVFTDEEQLAFCERFGRVERAGSGRRKRLDVAGLTDVSNLDEGNEVFARDDERHLFSLANQLWHTDSSFKPVPATFSMLSCREATRTGGQTEFADMRGAYDALAPETQALIEDLIAEHAFIHSRRMLGFDGPAPNIEGMPAVLRPIVHVHAGSARKSLYLASHALRILDRPVPEGRLLLAELTEHATQPAFVFRHEWSAGDFVLWDNRCTMHRGLRYPADQRRDMRRTTTLDGEDSSLIVAEREAAAV